MDSVHVARRDEHDEARPVSCEFRPGFFDILSLEQGPSDLPPRAPDCTALAVARGPERLLVATDALPETVHDRSTAGDLSDDGIDPLYISLCMKNVCALVTKA